MYLEEFPDIEWLRKNASTGFVAGKDYRGNQLTSEGWPTVILKVQSPSTERNNIKGPFSLFFNLEGKSMVGLNKKWYRVSDSYYCLSNEGEPFDLHIPAGQKTLTSNIHFGNSLYSDVVGSLSQSTDWSLDNADSVQDQVFEVLPRTEFMSDELRSKLGQLHHYQHVCAGQYSLDREYEMSTAILEHLMLSTQKNLKRIANVRAQKKATRMELFKRVNLAVDYMHCIAPTKLDLENISRHCGLSKFHFIRVFKDIYGQSPSNYLDRIKAEMAYRLIENSQADLSSIALELGFSELSAFTRFFKRMTGKPPSAIR